ncbi:hypothetical protein H7Y40_00440 [Pedobacter sp.]|nr:hypothetical protein [Candidatus Saccharibacteria bacterium]
MKRFGLLLSTALVVLVSPFVSAVEPLDDARIEIIRQNCTEAQVTIQQVLRSDTASRVNRGRAYEETIKLLAAFNSRAALNTYNVPDLIESTALFESEFSAFKTTYINYDIALKDTLKIKCTEQPVTFYDALTKTREKRAALALHITTMDRLLDTYETGLVEVSSQIKVKTASTN